MSRPPSHHGTIALAVVLGLLLGVVTAREQTRGSLEDPDADVEIVVVRHDLAPGRTLRWRDLATASVPARSLPPITGATSPRIAVHGLFLSRRPAVGGTTTRALRAGEVLQRGDVQHADALP
jgi:hypothetical protein